MGQLGGIGKVIYHELGPRVRNPEGVWDWIGGKRRALKAMCRHLANREVYNYFKVCSIVKSRILSGVIEKNFISLEFMGDLLEPNSAVSQAQFSKYLRRVDGHLNSESVEKQFGQSDVYDSTAEIFNRNRFPGSRAKGKDNARSSKGARRNGQREVNRTEGIDNHGGSDNYQTQEVFGY